MAKKTNRYTISITNQLIAMYDATNDQHRVVKTPDLIAALTHTNALYDTGLIDPGLKYLSVDYSVGNKICCDIAFEFPPMQIEGVLVPWTTILFTVQAPVTNYKKVTVVPGSFHVFISEHQIYNALTEVHVPTFVRGISERGAIELDAFYEAVNEFGFYTPFGVMSVYSIIRAAFVDHVGVDTKHPDFVKLAEINTAAGYKPEWTAKQAGEAKFSFDFSFLPSYEFGAFIEGFGKNTFNRVTPRSLFDFLNVGE